MFTVVWERLLDALWLQINYSVMKADSHVSSVGGLQTANIKWVRWKYSSYHK